MPGNNAVFHLTQANNPEPAEVTVAPWNYQLNAHQQTPLRLGNGWAPVAIFQSARSNFLKPFWFLGRMVSRLWGTSYE